MTHVAGILRARYLLTGSPRTLCRDAQKSGRDRSATSGTSGTPALTPDSSLTTDNAHGRCPQGLSPTQSRLDRHNASASRPQTEPPCSYGDEPVPSSDHPTLWHPYAITSFLNNMDYWVDCERAFARSQLMVDNLNPRENNTSSMAALIGEASRKDLVAASAYLHPMLTSVKKSGIPLEDMIEKTKRVEVVSTSRAESRVTKMWDEPARRWEDRESDLRDRHYWKLLKL